MSRNRKFRGFTLVEIMIVVLIIGILMAIAIPNFLNARANSRQKTCVEILKKLDGAKEQWAMDNRAVSGATVLMSDLTGAAGYLEGPVAGPACPGGGAYDLNLVGTNPTCSLSGPPDLHVLPN